MSKFGYLQRKMLHLISNKEKSAEYHVADFQADFKNAFASSIEFFKRFKGQVNLKDKTILDIGCGVGATCYYAVLNGAEHVVGIDDGPEVINFARSKIFEYSSCRGKVEFYLLDDLSSDQFDIVLSKDSFEHYPDPERFMSVLLSHLKPKGKLVIGFSPLWKSPYGGHLWSLSRFPWVHILFPESVVMSEVRQYFEENDWFYADWAGGLNKMTVDRFMHIVQQYDLKIDYLKFNVSSNPKSRCVLALLNVLRLVPGLKEYFTINLYSILQIKSTRLSGASAG